jgi:membrane fusion protein (multidrug efflux system)
MKANKILIIIVLFIVAALIFNRMSSNSKQNTKDHSSKNKAPILVNGMIVDFTSFSNKISLSGSIEPNESVQIQSEVSGILESIHFKEGSLVQKGQLLFKINDIELRAQLSKSKSQEILVSENYRRAKLLLEKQAISQEELDIAYAEFESAKSQSQLIQAQIAKTRIVAPFSGTIGLRNISQGAYVSSSMILTQLVAAQQVKINFSVPEKFASQMVSNTKIQFTIQGFNEIFEAKIYAIQPNIDIATRTMQIRALASNNDGKLIPGSFVNVQLPLLDIQDAILIPTEAVIPIQNGKKVFIQKKGVAQDVIVETATRTDKSIMILSGLDKGDTLLTSGVMSLRNGSLIQVKLN